MTRFLFAAMSALLLAGCIPYGAVRVPDSLDATSGSAKSGIVFGSIGGSRPQAFTSQTPVFRAKGSEEVGNFTYVRDGLFMVPLDFEDNMTAGTVFATRLPPGEYELVDVRFFINKGQFGSTTFSAKQKFSIPFTVVEGRATYIGEFIAHPVMGKTLIGIPVAAGGYFVVSDRFERDYDVLKTREPAASAAPTNKAVPDARALSLPLIRPGQARRTGALHAEIR